MIKECEVLSYNKFLHILVFYYDEKPIQITAILDNECKTVFIEYKDNKYKIVKREEYEKYARNLNKRKNVKSDVCSELENSEL